MNNKINLDEMDAVNGGNFFADLEEVLRNIFADDAKNKPTSPEPLTGRGKC